MTKKPIPSSGKYAELYNHTCAHDGCTEFGPFGYGPLKRPDLCRWYCRSHRPVQGAA